MSRIPTPDSITADWLTEQLRAHGHIGARVRDFTRTQIGTGQIGKCIRFDLTLEGATPAAPISLVGKFPSDDPVSQNAGVSLRNYYREVNFYRTLAPRLDIPTPYCYYADIEDEGPAFVLLLEDMQPAVPGNQLEGCTPEVARAAVLALVGLHAPSWCDESLTQYDWLVDTPAEPGASMQTIYSELLPGFLERYRDQLVADEIDIISRVAESARCPLFQPRGTPFALEHIDYRLDNLLIDHRTQPPQITVVDWQSVKLGKPLNDVAYFLGAGLTPELRREVERQIVLAYHQALTATGIPGYDAQQCWEDYRRGSFAGFGVTVVASMLVQQTERGDAMFVTMARRHSRHALDLGADELL